MKKIIAGLFVMASTGLLTSCLVPVRGQVVAYGGPVVEYGYQPVLYDGYVVYYADGGIPFIWMNGVQFWIPETERPYYVNHYHQYSNEYHEWYSHRGEQYRGHRYSDQDSGRRALRKEDGRERVSQPVLRSQGEGNHERLSQPVLYQANDRERESKPVLKPANNHKSEPKSQPKKEHKKGRD